MFRSFPSPVESSPSRLPLVTPTLEERTLTTPSLSTSRVSFLSRSIGLSLRWESSADVFFAFSSLSQPSSSESTSLTSPTTPELSDD
jgi:hypothetical protein